MVRIREIEQELQSTKEYLQTTIEELETSNEELKSSNEELQSTNEELQSTNEELDTSREELQSTNEELRTVNAEHQQKIDELSKAYDDLNNLLRATEVATLFLDRDLRIRRFTPAARKIFRLIDRDIGRPIDDISTTLQYPDLLADIRSVLETLTRIDKEVECTGGEWYQMKIVPYRTARERHRRRRDHLPRYSEEAVAAEGGSLPSIVNRQPLLILDKDLNIVAANPAFYRHFQTRPEETVGRQIYELGHSQWDIPELRRLLEQIVPAEHQVRGFPGAGRVPQDRRADDAAQRPPDHAQGRDHRPHPPGLRGCHGTGEERRRAESPKHEWRNPKREQMTETPRLRDGI